MIKPWYVLLFLIVRTSTVEFPPLNLYIGTGGFGYGAGSLPLGAQSPYGALRVSPDTSDTLDIPIKFEHYAGYHYSDTHINVFSHTHTFGAGLQDYGEVGIFPVQIDDDHHLQRLISSRNGYRSEFKHEHERAEPGFYQVYLDTHNINVELTATEHVGVHRYSFNNTNKKHRVILVDSSYTLPLKVCNLSHVNIDPKNNEITGSVFFKGDFSRSFGGLSTYFTIKFTNWTDFGVWTNGSLVHEQTAADGCSSGAYIILPADQEQVTVYVGMSFVSIEQARTNLQMQTQLKSFDAIRETVQQKWLNEIARFEVSADWNHEAVIKFNSAIVHSLSSPTQWDESNGVYLGFDGQIHTKPDSMEHFYTDLSIWDVHRTQIPFIVFHDSQRANDIIRSIMLIVEQGGDLPKWPFANGYTNCMIGSHADILISDLIMKHENSSYLNMTQVIEALRKVANQQQAHDSRFNPDTYIKYQYVPFDNDSGSAPLTLSYSYDDWAIGNVMHAAGLFDEAQDYYNRSQWFEHVFDNKTKFFCARSSEGAFFCPSNEIEFLNPWDNRYVEGNAWHYRFFVPHNTPRLVELFGGKEIFAQELDTFFMRSRLWSTTVLPNPYYWPGNEHDLFSVWQFNYANRSDLTQKHSRWILDHVYTINPDGLPGNDDYGTLSAWYIFASMGFYPLAGSSVYLLGSPAFDRITIRRNNGQCTVTIIAHNNSAENIYVQRVLLNGKLLSTFPFIDHIEHLKCTTQSSSIQLDFFMSSTPS
ncbi:unnamed protein product [Rotaria socialis]|uniref:Alpha-1,2-mannosidase n=1 Tax=Rotaria socialis TaxID=392032 RepID=A0A818FBM9_9BILA|nr:unnamed protein product [Rotaria socialis]CAF3472541.1 unnamed protein product [Rotaria socialis]CAF4391676.1 unnamed protein product [Rotaria socialis]CAF4482501.1 unnamed protein product [Rotaria socialis]